MPMHIVNPAMATMWSKAHAAITSDGMPFSTPYPCRCNDVIQDTRMAGEMAASTNARDSASAGGMLNILYGLPKEGRHLLEEAVIDHWDILK